jgi:hypothetical protein
LTAAETDTQRARLPAAALHLDESMALLEGEGEGASGGGGGFASLRPRGTTGKVKSR